MLQAFNSLPLAADTWFQCLAGLRGLCVDQSDPGTVIFLRSTSVFHYQYHTTIDVFRSSTIDATLHLHCP
jgi:hypothetical protein